MRRPHGAGGRRTGKAYRERIGSTAMKNYLTSIAVPRIPMNALVWGGGMALVLGLWYLLVHGQMNLLAALMVGGALLLIATLDRATGAIWTLGYLTVMGDLRRIVTVSFGQSKLDLLLLVAPALAVVLAVPLMLRIRLKDPLSKAMLVLLLVMVLEIFNPQQGGLAVGATGTLFYIVPVLWFWIGRKIASPAIIGRLLYGCIFPLALFAAVLGVCQTFIGFLPYQQAWIDVAATTYNSLHVGGSIRAFGFSVSAAEYAVLLMMGATGAAAAYFGPRRNWTYALPFLVVALVLASSRGNVIKLIFALAIVYTLRSGRKLDGRAMFRLGVLTVLGLAGVFALASHFSGPSESKPTYQKGDAAQNALEHQASGFAHPLNSKTSTAGIHAKVILAGIVQGFVAPLGHGLGATTLAARRFGGDSSTGSSEIDFGDMFISLGLIGGLTYIYIIYQTVRHTLRFVQTVPREISLPTLGILAATLSTWLIGGQYSISSILFFLIGGLVYSDNRTVERAAPASEPRAEAGLSNSAVLQY